ncbi:hypothetical protein ACERIT_09085 [Halopenitus sp. H-Gu1]|uniref:DUF7331 family protein n=1 Tax=Halopenitus sp. H-Gu1 TaxID=3242697 RepID=UPI00359E0404
MTSDSHADGTHRSDARNARAAAIDVEAYEDGDNVVLFDADNPLAWVEASRSVRLRDAA